jgi:hypothetical protein
VRNKKEDCDKEAHSGTREQGSADVTGRECSAVVRKLKGVATAQLADGRTVKAEVHWYEAHGIGRREFKIKRVLASP